jgi:drug/metabolite transporter (DMT)-like permease
MIPRSSRGKAEAALICIALIWGGTFVLVKSALDDVSTLVFLALRFTLATAALAVVFRGRLRASPEQCRVTLRAGLLAGCCLFAGYFFQTLGLRYTTPSKSAFITGLSVALVPLLAALVHKKAPLASEVVGVVGATAGLGLLTLPPGRFSIGYGDSLTMGCAVAFAFHILVLGRCSSRSSIELLSVSQIAVTALLSLAVCGWAETPSVSWSGKVLGTVLITGLLATALAFTVQAWAQSHTTATRTALIFAIEPVSAALTSYIVMGEVLTGRNLAGAVLILGGVLLVELKPSARQPHPHG